MKKIILLLSLLVTACATHDPAPSNDNSKAAEANIKLSLAYLTELHDAKSAKEKLLIAQKQAPDDPLVWDATGYFYEMTGNLTAAENAYLQAIQLAPTQGAMQNNYGTFLCRQKKYTLAIKRFLLATADPNYLSVADAYENAAQCALKIPNPNLANQYFQLAKKNRLDIVFTPEF